MIYADYNPKVGTMLRNSTSIYGLKFVIKIRLLLNRRSYTINKNPKRQ